MAQRYSIGQVAVESGLPIDTIRYYEKSGLIEPPERRASGYRAYAPDVVRRLRFIARAKTLGFTLGEIGELLALSAPGQDDMGVVKAAAQTKLADVEARIAELGRVRDGLQQLIEACPGHGALATCPILESLQGGEPVKVSGGAA